MQYGEVSTGTSVKNIIWGEVKSIKQNKAFHDHHDKFTWILIQNSTHTLKKGKIFWNILWASEWSADALKKCQWIVTWCHSMGEGTLREGGGLKRKKKPKKTPKWWKKGRKMNNKNPSLPTILRLAAVAWWGCGSSFFSPTSSTQPLW